MGASGTSQPQARKSKTVTLGPGIYVLQLGKRVEVGDKIRCITVGGTPAGGGGVMPPGQFVGSSTGFEEQTKGGAAHITCPDHPGAM
jgi:hypothetical protein